MPDTATRSHGEASPQAVHTALVIGAGGSIGQALFQRWQQQEGIDRVIGISRLNYPEVDHDDDGRLWVQSDYTEESIAGICANLQQDGQLINHVCICNGILHNERVWPDKRIEDISVATMQELFTVNTLVPMLWLKYLLPVLKGRHHCSVAVFSARIGSIGDNRSGGWYGYRATKAALNMMLKTASIEFARRARNVKIIAFHPGTTDSNLSRPFLKNVKHEILQPETVADSLAAIMLARQADGELSYVDWENAAIEW